ncbi:integrase/recombinase XerC [Alkalihalobacillus xiaoxiensis]|uniref:Integrase/recombinase XerC n=1 Tax=Shouchella xiaoxiensis TaxID=766895 RepID=A0ABS2SXM2_9BACI|nr:tyrosine-type recombinase/integrase [Shouchella xiaoxiensis]MBM7840253.1 integrase/recombinase XerC [Shouchella xiaoxiensis]
MSIFARLNEQHTNQATLTNDFHSSHYRRYNDMPSFVQQYIDSIGSLGYSPTTIQRYLYDFLDFFSYVQRHSDSPFLINDIQLSDFAQLNQKGIEHYISYLSLEVQNEAKTINRKLSALQSLFTYLVKNHSLADNPVVHVTRPKTKKRNPVYLTVEEIKEITDLVCSSEGLTTRQQRYFQKLYLRDYTAIMMLARTGLRLSELASLRMSQINIVRKELVVFGKGNKERLIPIPNDLVDIINNYVNSIPSNYQPKRDDYFFIGYDFKTDSYTSSLSISAFQKMIGRHFDRASQQIPSLRDRKLSAHKLRHSFATALIKNGVNVLTIQQLLGHTSVATTQVYAHIHQEAKRDAMNKWQ